MENQHRIIKGYRELSAEEIALMNEVKEAGQTLATLLTKVEKHIANQYDTACNENVQADADELEDLKVDEAELERLETASPYHWLTLARDDLQTGIMKLVRTVAQPTTF